MIDAEQLKEILENNPGLDVEKIVAGLKALRVLKQKGFAKGYNLATPAERRKVFVGRNACNDPRGVHARLVR